MRNKLRNKLKGNEKIYLGFIFILLGCSNIIRIISLREVIVFCFTLGSFAFALSDFFERIKGVLIFIGLLCIVGLPLLSDPQIIQTTRTYLSEETILLFTIGIGFINLYLSEPKKQILNMKLKREYEKGKADAFDEFSKKLADREATL